MSLIRRLAVPLQRFLIILQGTPSLLIQHTQIELRPWIGLLRRLAVPLPRVLVVLWDAFSMAIHHTQIELRRCMSLLRRLAVPLHGFLSLLRDALSIAIHHTQIELRCCNSLLCEGSIEPCRLCIVTSIIGGFRFLNGSCWCNCRACYDQEHRKEDMPHGSPTSHHDNRASEPSCNT